ncbi:MAG: hypothetical protein IPM92_02670 [Saprospiraceae bacterium]|nr:hypothetical protein [Saprospiraceae bacterium]
MHLKFKYFFGSGLLIVLLSLLSCTEDKNQTTTTWCVLLDMSGVRQDLQTRQRYSDNFTKLIEKIGAEDVLVVGLITESSINEPEYIANHKFLSFKPTTDNELIMNMEKSKFDSVLNLEKSMITTKVQNFILNSERLAKTTDIISAIHVAENVFKKNTHLNKYLILLSDMEQYSADYRFPVENLNDDRNKQIIELEQKKPRGLPDLTGVKVYVAGARSRDSDRFFRIKNFWLTYFDACHASLMKEDYGAALIQL